MIKRISEATREKTRQREHNRRNTNPDAHRAYKRELYRQKPYIAKRGAAKWKALNREKARRTILNCVLKKKYGITLGQYNDLLEKQGRVCAICRKPDFRRLAVDHDHETNRIRGLLCGRCNTALGFMQDSVLIFESAIRYLEKDNDA